MSYKFHPQNNQCLSHDIPNCSRNIEVCFFQIITITSEPLNPALKIDACWGLMWPAHSIHPIDPVVLQSTSRVIISNQGSISIDPSSQRNWKFFFVLTQLVSQSEQRFAITATYNASQDDVSQLVASWDIHWLTIHISLLIVFESGSNRSLYIHVYE